MQIFSKEQGDTLIIFLVGELDEHASSYARTKIDSILSNNNMGKIVFDLSQLEFMDSTGIGVFLGRYKKAFALKMPIFIANAKHSVDRVLKLSGIYNIMPKISS